MRDFVDDNGSLLHDRPRPGAAVARRHPEGTRPPLPPDPYPRLRGDTQRVPGPSYPLNRTRACEVAPPLISLEPYPRLRGGSAPRAPRWRGVPPPRPPACDAGSLTAPVVY